MKIQKFRIKLKVLFELRLLLKRKKTLNFVLLPVTITGEKIPLTDIKSTVP